MKNLIVKDNALIEASHRLGEIEQRLILLAILKARSQCNTIEQLQGKTLIIHADDYIKTFNVDKSTSYRVLKKAVLNLFRAEWGYKFINEKGLTQVAYRRFIQSADYVNDGAIVQFKFADDTVPMLVEMEKRFTVYEVEQVAKLSSQYAMRLYEFCIQHLDKKTGKGWLEISLDELRFRFGLLPNEYKTMSNFKAYILNFSINQINEHTDLTTTYTQKKQGRNIVGFRFEFKRKNTKKKAIEPKESNNRDKDTPDLFDGLTDIERQTIQKRIDEHIKRLENKGDTVSDFHRQNITKKAIEERWGLDVLVKQQEKAERSAERKARQLAEQQAEQEHQESERRAIQERNNAMIALFESLTPEEQEFVLDEVQSKVGVLKGIFKKHRANNQAHTTPIFASYFYEIFEL